MNNVIILGLKGHHEIFSKMFNTEEIQVKHNIKTKYYQTEVYFHLYSMNEKVSKDLLSNTQSCIYIIDSFDTFKAVKSHQSDISLQFETNLCVIVKEVKKKEEISEWCLDQGFELVDFEEEGVERIFEAIECTMWPKMTMVKDEKKELKLEERIKEKMEEKKEVIKDLKQVKELKEDLKDTESEKEEKILDNYFKNLNQGKDFEEEDIGDETEQDFEKLFTQILDLKKNTKNLSDEERKERAAKIALALLDSMGGDEEEEEE